MKFYQRTWFILLMFLLVWTAPVGLYLMWKHKKNWVKPVKIGFSVFYGLIILFVIIGMVLPDNSKNQSAGADSSVTSTSDNITEEATSISSVTAFSEISTSVITTEPLTEITEQTSEPVISSVESTINTTSKQTETSSTKHSEKSTKQISKTTAKQTAKSTTKQRTTQKKTTAAGNKIHQVKRMYLTPILTNSTIRIVRLQKKYRQETIKNQMHLMMS